MWHTFILNSTFYFCHCASVIPIVVNFLTAEGDSDLFYFSWSRDVTVNMNMNMNINLDNIINELLLAYTALIQAKYEIWNFFL